MMYRAFAAVLIATCALSGPGKLRRPSRDLDEVLHGDVDLEVLRR